MDCTILAAHSSGTSFQSLTDHLTQVADLTEQFARAVPVIPENLGRLCGLLHDAGKVNPEFQKYIRNLSDAQRGDIDHSTAGGQIASMMFNTEERESIATAELVALVVMSHHSGLIDCLKINGDNELERRWSKAGTYAQEAYAVLEPYLKPIHHPLRTSVQTFWNRLYEMFKNRSSGRDYNVFRMQVGLVARFLVSCLVDADRIDTERFCYGHAKPYQEPAVDWETFIKRMEDQYARYQSVRPNRAEQKIYDLRQQVANACLKSAPVSPGIFQLTVPTGGGKTEASIRFALHHAHRYRMRRIVYVAPYVTIIEQNASKIRKILERKTDRGTVVFEHHSNIVPPEGDERVYHRLAETWDAPIVFTTQVQFFETFFGAGTRDVRRMHRLAQSVVIFDEVQTVPVKLMYLFTEAVRFLTEVGNSSVVLCTATQPPLDQLSARAPTLDIRPERQIIQYPKQLVTGLKRVVIKNKIQPMGYDTEDVVPIIASALKKSGNVLAIVNTKTVARTLYILCKKAFPSVPVYHLSTNMCPAHRMATIRRVMRHLAAGDRVICVSTQLIEAGVDIDFGAVVRSVAGIDSVVQAAGRCNRHGIRPQAGEVYIIKIKDEQLGSLPILRSGQETAYPIIEKWQQQKRSGYLFEWDAVDEYYRNYYHSHEKDMVYPVRINGELSGDHTIVDLLSANSIAQQAWLARAKEKPKRQIFFTQSFRTANSAFAVIESNTQGIIVPYGDGREIIRAWQQMNPDQIGVIESRKAQPYTVNVFESTLKTLMEKGALYRIWPDMDVYAVSPNSYHDEYGVFCDADPSLIA